MIVLALVAALGACAIVRHAFAAQDARERDDRLQLALELGLEELGAAPARTVRSEVYGATERQYRAEYKQGRV